MMIYDHTPTVGAPFVAEPLAPKDIRILLSVERLYHRKGRVVIGEVAEATGYSRSTVHDSLHYLRNLGFVDLEPGHAGTLRPKVKAFPCIDP